MYKIRVCFLLAVQLWHYRALFGAFFSLQCFVTAAAAIAVALARTVVTVAVVAIARIAAVAVVVVAVLPLVTVICYNCSYLRCCRGRPLYRHVTMRRPNTTTIYGPHPQKTA